MKFPNSKFPRKAFYSTLRSPNIFQVSQVYGFPEKDEKLTEASLNSNELLVRGGFIRQTSAGIFNFLPLGLRVLNKLEKIIDEEMHQIGGQKLMLPLLSWSQTWKKTGRWETNESEMFTLKDRKGSTFCLAPTHEEEITSLVASTLSSYRQLPLLLYQIGKKYRDELRPRSGLLRSREFIMKDMYSFDVDEYKAKDSYKLVTNAYRRIFDRLGIEYVRAEADSGNIGGDESHEYHYLTKAGDDSILVCKNCAYAANEEKATGITAPSVLSTPHTYGDLESVVYRLLGQDFMKLPENFDFDFKAKMYIDRERYVIFLYSPDRELSTFKIWKSSSPIYTNLIASTLDNFVPKTIQIVVDSSILHGDSNKASQKELTPTSESYFERLRSIPISVFIDSITFTKHDDFCPKCNPADEEPRHRLKEEKGIEVAHTFYLGTKYSAPLKAKFKNQVQDSKLAEMGCYGIGVSRMLSAIIEKSHDADGIIWPAVIAPFSVSIIPLYGVKGALEQALKLAKKITNITNLDVLVDDRVNTSYKTKIADSMLIGCPMTVILGREWDMTNRYEVRIRETGKTTKSDESEILKSILLQQQINTA
ncbi:hypothetical protein HK098_001726 [Nowakowskiella sp. JEL0407]|nr:hypothetical protein HK098_001726 [Nowakowskiella sp. JEL0407]